MDENLFRHPFPEYGAFIRIKDLLWQTIFLHSQLI